MAWIEPSDVSDVYSTVTPTQALCDHIQGLAESVIGEQDEPISKKLKAVMVEIITQFWAKTKQSEKNPDGFRSERVDDYEYVNFDGSGALGLGLTDKAKKALRLAAGLHPLQVVSTTRNAGGEVEMAEPFQRVVLNVDDPDLI